MSPVAEHGDPGKKCEGNIMKKTAFRIIALGGGLIATLLAGGAWGRF
jgi:hypothetical protein